ncbi:MAG: DUF2309 domain-containing protein [Myxococcales bacterium]|nr:DUF2309 domain-containing protein [Myxococcales bacterium]
MHSTSGGSAATPDPGQHTALEDIVRHVGHLLPAQGPIDVFIHHNTLHAFADLTFDDAVLEAGRIYGCQPYLSEDRYRDELRSGRIDEADVTAVLAATLGLRGEERVVGEHTRLELWRRMVVYGLPERAGEALGWELSETDVLVRLRGDLPADARQAAGLSSTASGRRAEESRYVAALWSACQAAAQRGASAVAPDVPRPRRPRDIVLAARGIDIDDWVHPILIRTTSAFLDQGLADWPMAGRDRGLYRCFIDLYSRRIARLCRPIGKQLLAIARAELESGRDGLASLQRSLEELGQPRADWQAFLRDEALALRGFAGMIHQIELRPDRAPTRAVDARLADLLAVRLVIVRAALAHAAARSGAGDGPLDLRAWLDGCAADSSAPPAPTTDERAWALFHMAQLAGLTPANVEDLHARDIDALQAERRALDGVARRRVLHQAYERRLRHRFYDALLGNRAEAIEAPAFQAIFCIDEREESIRRHLEEVDPLAETFGVAGFFGVAMYYRGATDAHARPLCPVSIRPRHFIAELDDAPAQGLRQRLLRRWQHIGALVDKNVHLGSRRARLGAVFFAALGALWVVPLLLRVVFPWLYRALARSYDGLQFRRARLGIAHQPHDSPPAGEQSGFTTEEMAEIVYSQLVGIGIRDRFAPLVLVLGHGSTSLNNPHEAAHDCGACGGGRGGPNARALAQMANLPEVRSLLASRGLHIPSRTWFVGGERNTASNDITLYDTDESPEHVRALLQRAVESLQTARRREAHERCRRFESAGAWLPPAAALWHVQARSADLAQPRPEFGHATNAFCFVGRRARTRGLFLDRRAFLVSYDPEGDADGALLEKTLAGVVPVVAGISLEYLFGYIDPTGYGSGTKLPHNVTALVGVMDGAQSDLRTGLPWQMLEIHEPVRLAIVVEAKPSLLQELVARDAELQRLVDHRWVLLAALDPTSAELVELDSASATRYVQEHALHVTRGDSRRHYQGRRGHLPLARIEPAAHEGA